MSKYAKITKEEYKQMAKDIVLWPIYAVVGSLLMPLAPLAIVYLIAKSIITGKDSV